MPVRLDHEAVGRKHTPPCDMVRLHASGAAAQSVQHALLKIMEGAPVRLRGGVLLDTSRVRFICGGTFVGLAVIIASQQRFAGEGVDLAVAARVFAEIADPAIEYKTGARSLRGLFAQMVGPVLFALPDRPDVKPVAFDSLYDEPRLVAGAGGA